MHNKKIDKSVDWWNGLSVKEAGRQLAKYYQILELDSNNKFMDKDELSEFDRMAICKLYCLVHHIGFDDSM